MVSSETSRRTSREGAVTLGIEDALARVRRALTEMGYGEIIIKVEAGKPIWVDKHERERVG